MCRKLIYLVCFVLALTLVSSASGQQFYTWIGDPNDFNSGLWNEPNNWDPVGPPPHDSGNVGLSTGFGSVITIPAGYTADCTWGAVDGTIYGPEWGTQLDIYGSLTYEWYIAPVQTDPCEAWRSVINMYDGSSIGPHPVDGGAEGIALGGNWWFYAPYVTMNMYEGSSVDINWLWIGGWLNMYGGTMDISGGVNMGAVGQYPVADELIRIDIHEGTLILPADFTDEVEDWINRGILLAYGETPGQPRGPSIVIDNDVNPGRTTVTALPTPSPEASRPNPPDGATDVTRKPILTWVPGLYSASHELYFSSNFDDVNNRTATKIELSDPCYPILSPLESEQTYYWAIDEVNDAGPDPCLWPGDVWYFTTGDYFVVDDFDSYASDNDLWAVWKDGWAPGNNTGAEVYRETTLVRDGRSMKYEYEDISDFSYYSEAYADTADLPSQIGSDWTIGGVKVLVLYFYGQSGNDANEQMYVRLQDADSNATVTYGDYGEDPNDLRVEQWHEWDINLNDFNSAGVDLTGVTRITIGFGDGSEPPGNATGTVHFEDIRLYPRKCCPLSLKLEADFTGDCKVDTDDLQRMTEIWLGQMPTPPQPVIQLDASALAEGTLSTWANTGSLGGAFQDFNSANPNDNPTVATVEDIKAVVFDGNDLLKADFNAPASITGNNPFTVIYTVWNPEIGFDEEVFCWAKRGTDANYAAVCYGSAPDWGAAAHWAVPYDMGFDRGVPAANTWHTIAVTYQGDVNGIETVMVDGIVNATEAKTLNLWANNPVTVGSAYDGDPDDPCDPTITPMYPFSGALANLKVYSVAISPRDLAVLIGTPIDLKKDDVINLKDYAVLADMWLEEELWPKP